MGDVIDSTICILIKGTQRDAPTGLIFDPSILLMPFKHFGDK